jgi:adenylate cyclase
MHGMTRFWMGDVAIGVPQLEEGIALYDDHRQIISGKTPLFDHGVGCRRYQAVSLWLLGYPDRAARRAAEAVRDARNAKHPLTLASTLGFVSMLHHFRREIGATAETAAEAVACTREYVLTYWLGFSAALHGWAAAQLADSSTAAWEEGVTQIRESLEAHRSAGARTFGSLGRGLLAEAYMLRGRFDEAQSTLDDGLLLASEAKEGFWEAELHRLLGELALLRGVEHDAEDHFERAIAVARTRQERSLELRALASLSRLVRSRADAERTDHVRVRLSQAYDWFTEGFDTADLREARALLVTDADQ